MNPSDLEYLEIIWRLYPEKALLIAKQFKLEPYFRLESIERPAPEPIVTESNTLDFWITSLAVIASILISHFL